MPLHLLESVPVCWFHTGTSAKASSVPCTVPVLHQDGESVEDREFHPQVIFSLLGAINLHHSVHSCPHFVIKCCNFLVCRPRSCLASSPRRLMRSCSSQIGSWFGATSDQRWTCCSQSAGCRQRMKGRFVPIEKKWVMLASLKKKKKVGLG